MGGERQKGEKSRGGRSRRGFLKVSELEARLMKRPRCETRVRYKDGKRINATDKNRGGGGSLEGVVEIVVAILELRRASKRDDPMHMGIQGTRRLDLLPCTSHCLRTTSFGS